MIVTSPKQIALHYLRGYFFIDLIATIPFGYILTSSSFAVTNKVGKLGRLPKLVKFVRAARMLKLLRVYRLHDFVLKLEVKFNVNHGYSRMIKIVTMILLVTHMVGCFWFLIGITGGEEGEEGEQGWVRMTLIAMSSRTQSCRRPSPSKFATSSTKQVAACNMSSNMMSTNSRSGLGCELCFSGERKPRRNRLVCRRKKQSHMRRGGTAGATTTVQRNHNRE